MEDADKLRWAKRLGHGNHQDKLPKHFVEFWDRYCKRYYEFHSNRTPDYSMEGLVAFMAEVTHENKALIEALTQRVEALEGVQPAAKEPEENIDYRTREGRAMKAKQMAGVA